MVATDVGKRVHLCQKRTQYINAFAASEYILGYPDGSFKPDNNISRAEFVVIINRITKLTAEPTENLTDIEKHWAYNEITIATK